LAVALAIEIDTASIAAIAEGVVLATTVTPAVAVVLAVVYTCYSGCSLPTVMAIAVSDTESAVLAALLGVQWLLLLLLLLLPCVLWW
jgi:hypothetical protein